MTLFFKHFDTRLNQWIANENPQIVNEHILTEKLDNTLLELYFPNQQFSFGHIDEKSTVDDRLRPRYDYSFQRLEAW